MFRQTASWRTLAAAGTIIVLAGCATSPVNTQVASNPPPVPPGPSATWYHITFDTGSYALDSQGQVTIADITGVLQQNPRAIVTIIGRTDAIGSADYNMHLSHQRADAVRDALVYHKNVAADRVETRWTGEAPQRVASNDAATREPRRIVDIAIH